MTPQEFEQYVSRQPLLEPALTSAARAAAPQQTRGTFGGPTELAAIAVLFPVATFIVRNIGLPWLHEVKRYAELWRLRFHRWIDQQHTAQGFDPDQAEAAGTALRDQLQATTDPATQAAWQRLADLLQSSPDHKT
jgi:hypothetical protein